MFHVVVGSVIYITVLRNIGLRMKRQLPRGKVRELLLYEASLVKVKQSRYRP